MIDVYVILAIKMDEESRIEYWPVGYYSDLSTAENQVKKLQELIDGFNELMQTKITGTIEAFERKQSEIINYSFMNYLFIFEPSIYQRKPSYFEIVKVPEGKLIELPGAHLKKIKQILDRKNG